MAQKWKEYKNRALVWQAPHFKLQLDIIIIND